MFERWKNSTFLGYWKSRDYPWPLANRPTRANVGQLEQQGRSDSQTSIFYSFECIGKFYWSSIQMIPIDNVSICYFVNSSTESTSNITRVRNIEIIENNL